MIIDAVDYIPHDGKMALLDQIIELGESHIVCSVNLGKSGHFVDSEGRTPSWLGIEYMAQTIAAYAGSKDKEKGLPVKVGFLLGARKLILHADFFEDKTIYVKAELVFQNEELGNFKCTVSSDKDNTPLAEASVNVFQPIDINKFLEENNPK